MVAKVYTGTTNGIEGILVCVEADISDGLPMFDMVGYLGAEVKEARERVRTALKNSGFRLPPSHITVNLSPADLRKQGNYFDLPIALAVLAAAGFVRVDELKDKIFIGELGLDGSVRPVNGTLVLAECGCNAGIRKAVVPQENAKEAAYLEETAVYGVSSLSEIVTLLNNPDRFDEKRQLISEEDQKRNENNQKDALDFSDLYGQERMKRAAMVAAAGLHNLLYIGTPGSGKSMAAKRIPTILPSMTYREQLEVTKIYSVAGLLDQKEGLIKVRPFRSPHHTISATALAGGGRFPRPGEISLAHHGVLFLDELAEFKRDTLEVMRQPLEDGKVTISRVNGSCSYPADFMLVAAMNPCPCGYYPDRSRCHCSPGDICRYRDRISRPMLDRIDLCTEACVVKFDDLSQAKKGESSASMRERVTEAIKRQQLRYQDEGILFNSQLSGTRLTRFCHLSKSQNALLRHAFESMGLSVRARDRILRVARTIADLEGSEEIQENHLAEAISYRSIDRKYWGTP
jgi:magnesium chelatase family protein